MDLISKPIFLVSREDYDMVVDFYQGVSSNKKKEAGDKDDEADAGKEETFDNSFVNELVRFGGIKRAVAMKTIERETCEDKTMYLTEMLNKIKAGTLEIDDEDNEGD